MQRAMRRSKYKIVCICQIDSRILVLGKNRLTNLWFFDSRIFGDEREINDLVDSHLIGPDIGRHVSLDLCHPSWTRRHVWLD
jgi:hypothetical protein